MTLLETLEQAKGSLCLALKTSYSEANNTNFNEAITSIDEQIKLLENAEPVSAEIRFCNPQKSALDSGWGPWQRWNILKTPPKRIDSQGYLVGYRLLFTHPSND